MKTIYELNLHETIDIYGVLVMRVDNGWIYHFDNGNIFIKNTKEFYKEKKAYTNNQKTTFNLGKELIGLGCEESHVRDWMKIKKVKSETVLKGIIRECKQANITIAKAVQIASERGWQGIQAKYFENITIEQNESKAPKRVMEGLR
jgi:hypothetical protein